MGIHRAHHHGTQLKMKYKFGLDPTTNFISIILSICLNNNNELMIARFVVILTNCWPFHNYEQWTIRFMYCQNITTCIHTRYVTSRCFKCCFKNTLTPKQKGKSFCTIWPHIHPVLWAKIDKFYITFSRLGVKAALFVMPQQIMLINVMALPLTPCWCIKLVNLHLTWAPFLWASSMRPV